MVNDDTIKLLRECDAGVKMGISSFEDIYDNVKDENIKKIIDKSKEKHERFQNEISNILEEYKDDGKNPPMMAEMMAKMKAEMKLMLDDPNKSAANFIIDGCNMGIKNLNKYLNQYVAAENKVKKLVEEVIKEEECVVKAMEKYL